MALFVEGKLFKRAGEGSGGGGDQHNLGWYATQAALEEAHPTAEAGDFAIVGATDTVWIWDTDNSAWVDSDQKGQVTSVNNQTGAVTVSEVPSQTGQSGKFLTTDGTNASWGDAVVNKARADDTDTINILGDYYSSNKYSKNSVFIGNGAKSSYNGTGFDQVAVGASSKASVQGSAVGSTAEATGQHATAIGYGTEAGGQDSIALGFYTGTGATGAIQIGYGEFSRVYNNDANTFKVANANGNFEMMSADGTIPTARLTNAINKYSSMPTASADYLGQIVQFTGTTDATYTHGYIYECVSDGGNPATYSWTAVSVQAGGGSSLPSQTGNAGKFLTTDGTDASWSDKPLVNTATGSRSLTILGNATNARSGINIGADSRVATNGSIAIGDYAQVQNGNCAISIGNSSQAKGSAAVALGVYAYAYAANSIQLGHGQNNESDTLCFGCYYNNNWVNYKLLDSDGTIPTDRLASTTGLADGNYRLRLVMASGVPTLEWVAE